MSSLLHPADLASAHRPRARRGTFFVQTWGCQMNEEDSEQIARYMEAIGFCPAANWLEAQVILLNTCSVRKKPEDKAFSLLGEIALLKQRRPEIVVGVCGCMAQIRAKEIRQRAPHVDFVVGTGQISSIPGLVEETLQTRKFRTRLELPERKGAVVTDVPERLLESGVESWRDTFHPQPLTLASERKGLSTSISFLPSPTPSSQVKDELSESISYPPSPTPSSQGRKGLQVKIRSFLPIQYGCDKFCTFCIVPATRGRERSRPTEDIVAEARALAAAGCKEVTLLGQTVNSYGKNLAEGRVPFSKLLWLLEGIPGLERIRYTSPYPRDFKADLIDCIRDNPKVMEHVHLPLQSGDDEMLKAMKRQYSVEGFLKIVDELRSAVPTIGITTDIIVGYPGETDEQFERTMQIVEQVRFDGAYMFIYSPRPGTPAADLPQLPYSLKQGRLKQLADRQNEISLEKNREWIGRTVEVLVEGPSPKNPEFWQGYSREFKMVHFLPTPDQEVGDLALVEIESAHLWGIRGQVRAP